MLHRILRVVCLAVLPAVLLLLTTPIGAFAHKAITVANYNMELGFNTEPALQGSLNGLFFSVSRQEPGKPVANISSTLKAEVSFGTSHRVFPLEPQAGQQGTYVAWMVPTEAGSYTWRVYGTIEGKPVDVKASSGAGSFNAVQPVADLAFPGTGSAGSAGSTNVEPQLAALHDQIDAANRAASTARWIGLAGVILGVLAIVLSSVFFVRRRG